MAKADRMSNHDEYTRKNFKNEQSARVEAALNKLAAAEKGGKSNAKKQ